MQFESEHEFEFHGEGIDASSEQDAHDPGEAAKAPPAAVNT